MKTSFSKVIAVLVIILSLFSIVQISTAQDHNASYQLLEKQEEDTAYLLSLVVPEMLLEHYQEQNHQLSRLSDFARFVTPHALKPIADCLRQIYPEDEDFVNGVLMIVHQMDYVETRHGKYPAETLIDNQGDCDIFSYVAASIIDAGGINVILLQYEQQKHMNIGVNLATSPKNARGEVYRINYSNTDYYIAETTGGNWTRGWRVGECPTNVQQAEVQVITLDNSETVSPGQVFATLKKLEHSNLSFEVWPPITIEETTVTFRGSLIPRKANENVTIYLAENGSPWEIIDTVQTKADGSYEYVWKTSTAGVYAAYASWTGNNMFAGSTTETISTTVIPVYLGIFMVIAIIAIILGTIALVTSKSKNHDSSVSIGPNSSSFS